jgi:hypothetical protein
MNPRAHFFYLGRVRSSHEQDRLPALRRLKAAVAEVGGQKSEVSNNNFSNLPRCPMAGQGSNSAAAQVFSSATNFRKAVC